MPKSSRAMTTSTPKAPGITAKGAVNKATKHARNISPTPTTSDTDHPPLSKATRKAYPPYSGSSLESSHRLSTSDSENLGSSEDHHPADDNQKWNNVRFFVHQTKYKEMQAVSVPVRI